MERARTQGLNPKRHEIMLAMLKDGKSAQEVADHLLVVLEYVEKFADKKKSKPKKPRQGTKDNGDQ